MDATECRHVARRLIVRKLISDALEAERAQLADPEDPDEQRADHIF